MSRLDVFLLLCLCDDPTERAQGDVFPQICWRGTASGSIGVNLGIHRDIWRCGRPGDPARPGDVWPLVLVVLGGVRGGAAGGLREA